MIWSFQWTLLRDIVIVEGLCSGNNIVDSHGFDRGLFSVSRNQTSYAGYTPLGIRLPDAEIPNTKETWNHDVSISASLVDWVSLVEVMHQIIMRNTEECVKLEAISVMNLILIKSDAYMEREKYVLECSVEFFAITWEFISYPDWNLLETGLARQRCLKVFHNRLERRLACECKSMLCICYICCWTVCSHIHFSFILNYQLFRKLKLIEEDEFNHLIYVLTLPFTCGLK